MLTSIKHIRNAGFLPVDGQMNPEKGLDMNKKQMIK
jgi:hypothetical protein